ncbi:synaptic vesicular amine transporter-like [Strongylocentrotus purpuratus]|uniref:Major facilitator superfamily (MFS) profile domain-containing protein n=1 Tax=Strongylocentrotus purpuratus TaxID=7668 RepID=A0A7M7LWC6_STRPU|nr:synaptic vesicular amine transporter-like [Strongylocentrotus purpuratus]|eukprot:XP_011677174.1 PREDICTED: synaptic vesicular amine transporter-like [Strongylocentrotus purpuratus]
MGYSVNGAVTALRSSRTTILVVILVALFLDETLMTVVVPIIPDIFMKSYCSNTSSVEGTASLNGSHHLPQSGSDGESGMSDIVPISRLQEYSWYDEELANKFFAEHPSWFDDNSGIDRPTTTNLNGMDDELVNESEVDKGIGTTESLDECIKHVNIRTGLLLASKFMMRLVLSAPLGIFTEWIGYFIPLFISTIILLASCLAYAFGHSFVVFLIARLLHGVAATAIEIAGLGVVAYSYADDEEKRGFAIGLAISAFAFGSLAGPPFGSILYSFCGQASPFLILAAIALLLAFAEVLCISPEARNDSPDPAPVYVLVKDPLVLASAGAIAVAGAVIALLQSSLPLWLLQTTDAKDWQLGVIFLPSSIMQIISSVLLGFYGNRIGRWLCAMLSLLLLATSIATVPLVKQVVQLIPAMLGIGFSFGVVDSTMTASMNLVADIKYNGAYGAAAAISTFAFCVGFAIGPTISGLLVNSIGFPWTMRTMAILAAVYAPFCIVLKNVPGKDQLKGTERAVLLPHHQLETTAVRLQDG